MLYIIPTDTCYGIACALHDHKAYRKIYSIKKRELSKPLAIMVEDFSWLQNNTDLTEEQIDFLKNYKNPFTVLCNSLHINTWIQFENENEYFENRDVYEKIAFRVAHTSEQKKLLREVGPIFLTSANKSGEKECFTQIELFDALNFEVEKYKIKVLP